MMSASELSNRVLRANSATKELELWCQQHGIGDGRIVAIREMGAVHEELDDHSVSVLNGMAKEATFRRVQLVTGGIPVVDAVNWYFPGNLTAEMCDRLLNSDEPFGRVIAQFRPRRKTYLVKRAEAPRNGFAFEHRAIVHAEDASPLAVVHERFLTTLFRQHGR
jgi:chorismate-pyruvate lyase